MMLQMIGNGRCCTRHPNRHQFGALLRSMVKMMSSAISSSSPSSAMFALAVALVGSSVAGTVTSLSAVMRSVSRIYDICIQHTIT